MYSREQRYEDLLEDILEWLIDDQWNTWRYTEGEELYKDLHFYINEIRTTLKDSSSD